MKKIIFLLLACFFSPVLASVNMQLESAIILGERGIIVLQEDEREYRLEDTITRKEFMKVVVKIVGEQVEDICESKFSDVEKDWGCKYIEWALKKAFIAANSTFRPNDSITKAESMKLILKARNIARIEDNGDWRQDDMRTAYRKCIISEEYTDYDTLATRGWIFEVVATDTCSTGGGGSSSGGSTSSSSSSSSSGGEGDDWRNLVP